MQYKLVAIDIDGTLLNSNHEIPYENIETIKNLQDYGINFVIVTGRPDAMAKKYTKELQIPSVILGNNGATIRNVDTNELYFQKVISREKVLELHKFFAKKDIYYRIYGLDSIYSFNDYEFDEAKNEFAVFSKRLADSMNFKIINKIEELDEDVIKFVCFTNDHDKLITTQKELLSIDDLEIVRGSKNGVDINAKGISKGETLLKYAETLGISKEEIIAIGDSENDLSMLKVVGLPVTLENGDQVLKDIAHIITESNDNAGVAKVLKQIFFYNK